MSSAPGPFLLLPPGALFFGWFITMGPRRPLTALPLLKAEEVETTVFDSPGCRLLLPEGRLFEAEDPEGPCPWRAEPCSEPCSDPPPSLWEESPPDFEGRWILCDPAIPPPEETPITDWAYFAFVEEEPGACFTFGNAFG